MILEKYNNDDEKSSCVKKKLIKIYKIKKRQNRNRKRGMVYNMPTGTIKEKIRRNKDIVANKNAEKIVRDILNKIYLLLLSFYQV